jgi:hypothetical protein
MVDHYASIGKLVSPVGPASILSKAAENLGRGTSSLDKVSNCYTSLNNLKKVNFK